MMVQKIKDKLPAFVDMLVWASVHEPLDVQMEDMKATGREVAFLSEMNPELFQEMSNITEDSNLDNIAKKLAVFMQENAAVIVQPAGSPAFHFVLGSILTENDIVGSMTQMNENKYYPVIFAYTPRVSKEIIKDGKVEKISIFDHKGWFIL